MGKKLSSIPTVERLLNLAMFLISEKQPLTLRQIIDSVEGYSSGSKDFDANRRMFFRDKKDLQQLGLEIRVVKMDDPLSGHSTEGYIINEEDFYLPRINFTPAEADALAALAGRFTGPRPGHPFPELDWAVMKLTGGERKHPGDGAVLVQMNGLSHRPPQALLDDLRRAVSGRRRISITYRSLESGRASKRSVDPFGLAVRRGLWYLYGYCHLRREKRMFRVDRIDLLEKPRAGDGPDFELPEGFTLERELRSRAPWEFGADAAKEAVLRFHKDTYWLIKNAWGDIDSVRFDDRDCAMAVRSVNDTALIHWLLEFSDRVEIVSPPALRKKISDTLKGIISDAEPGV